jgi:ribose transport system ATP-binding protein
LYVSHFLEEVQSLADRWTVLRDGRSVASGEMRDVTIDDLVALMAGERTSARTPRSARHAGDVVLSVAGLEGEVMPRSASFELRAGEVLGIAGLVGAGRTELLRAIFGLDRVRRGDVRVFAMGGHASPWRRLSQSVGLLSEDRAAEGLALNLSIEENLTLSRLPAILSKRAQSTSARALIERLGIRARGPEQRVEELSGGNQQKVALARLLHHDVDVLLLDEPTRGVDVRSKREIARQIDELAARGKAIVVVSSQLPELLELCDRIAVMTRGRLGDARPASEWSEHALLLEATASGGAP